jgi:hypothetical protein
MFAAMPGFNDTSVGAVSSKILWASTRERAPRRLRLAVVSLVAASASAADGLRVDPPDKRCATEFLHRECGQSVQVRAGMGSADAVPRMCGTPHTSVLPLMS